MGVGRHATHMCACNVSAETGEEGLKDVDAASSLLVQNADW